MNNLRLRQSVGVVVTDGNVEFFKSNVRESIKIKIAYPNIIELLRQFDGQTNISDIASSISEAEVDAEQLYNLAKFLHDNHILIKDDLQYPDDIACSDYRLINTLEDLCHSSREVIECIKKINNANVMIVGLGAVGSQICSYLCQAGVGKLTLVDNDFVESSNLHRQFFFESDIGKRKGSALSTSLSRLNKKTKVDVIQSFINNEFFNEKSSFESFDLIINCADSPSVDKTSEWIATYCMKNRIPHIIGGGYNLHQTLIGQTIIPFKTACFRCFEIYLDEINNKELFRVKKLHREGRKLGSYSPLAGLAASLAALDALKVIAGKDQFSLQSNKRIEFNFITGEFNVTAVNKNPSCDWCGIKK